MIDKKVKVDRADNCIWIIDDRGEQHIEIHLVPGQALEVAGSLLSVLTDSDSHSMDEQVKEMTKDQIIQVKNRRIKELYEQVVTFEAALAAKGTPLETATNVQDRVTIYYHNVDHVLSCPETKLCKDCRDLLECAQEVGEWDREEDTDPMPFQPDRK